MSATNGRAQALDILSANDALVAAAEAAKRAVDCMVPDQDGLLSRDALDDAAQLAVVAESLSVYAATVGRWAAR